MLKRTWCTLLVVSIIVAIMVGVVIAILWHQRYCINMKAVMQNGETESIQQNDETESTQQKGETESTQQSGETESSFALDAEYANSYLEAASNYEKGEVNRQFAEKWKQEAQLYLNKICEIADEDFKQAIIAGQTAWENAYPIRMEEHFAYLQYVYGSGSIIPILQSKYGYDLQRERAIELYEMYTRANRIWEIFQEYGPLPTD